ncbi:glycosyltransferase family 2 protein [Oceaniglobus roseus]|uniref:glycosyltransferase family 2 protein n=1 Tax=Oceaniglobus roseus TaxID=1737570 RepID=UPI001FE8FC05|nr:glycosyltransferase [Kandeliimicrobium roseum]
MSLSVILPAHDEADYLGPCLAALLASDLAGAEVIVIANACRDATAEVARRFAADFAAKGWRLEVIETATGGKLNALNLGDAAARFGPRAYLDADVVVSPPLLSQIAAALDTGTPRYASGTPQVAAADNGVTRAYGRFWATLPFFATGVPGFGLYAVNAAGRQRWGAFPDIVSDDTFVRLSFAPAERVRVPATYSWPMVEGFANLVRVRRRQDRGVAEIARLFPALPANDDKAAVGVRGLVTRLLRDPAGFAVYAAVGAAVRLPPRGGREGWVRGR